MEQYIWVGIEGLVLRRVIPPTKVRHRKEKVKNLLLRDPASVPYLAKESPAPAPINNLFHSNESERVKGEDDEGNEGEEVNEAED